MCSWFSKFLFASACSVLAATAPAVASDSIDPEFPQETVALVNATVAYFESVEAEAGPKKRPPVIGLPQALKPSKVKATDTGILTRKGPVQHLTGYRITWYPTERLLGTVDFMGTWDGNRNLVCGYLTWDLTDPDSPVLSDVTASFVETATLADASPDDVLGQLLDANCAFETIDENQHFFDVSG